MINDTNTSIESKRNTFTSTGVILKEARDAFNRMSYFAQPRLNGWDGMAKKLTGHGRSQADRIIAGYEAYGNIFMGYMMDNGGCWPLKDDGFELPYSEYQLRPLTGFNKTRLPETDSTSLQYEMWCRALEIAKDHNKVQPTNYMVMWAVEAILDEKRSELLKRTEEIKAETELLMQDPNRVDPFERELCEYWDTLCVDCRDCMDVQELAELDLQSEIDLDLGVIEAGDILDLDDCLR
jgi:hypothetical protein